MLRPHRSQISRCRTILLICLLIALLGGLSACKPQAVNRAASRSPMTPSPAFQPVLGQQPVPAVRQSMVREAHRSPMDVPAWYIELLTAPRPRQSMVRGYW